MKDKFIERYCDWIWRRASWILFGALLLALAAALTASRLELRTNFAELLPSQDPAVEELARTSEKVGGTEVLQIAIESPNRAANLRLAEALERRIKKLPRRLVQMAAYDVRREQEFFREHKWLYADLASLNTLRDTLRFRIDKAKNPLLVDLLDEPESPEDIQRRLQERARQLNPFPTGYFEGEDGHIVVIVVRPPGGIFGEHVGEELQGTVVGLMAELQPASYHPAMRVGLTGTVMSQLEERAALENDLLWATAVCVFLVALAVLLFYGRWRALPQVAAPAFLGAIIAFAAAKLLYGYLNSSTAFMGSIIVGNGINFAIIQLARYDEERRAGRSARAAAALALGSTLRATSIAALGAAAAYGSLMMTRFRGFSQFGVIGAVGMIAAWLGTVTILPAVWAVFDRRPEAARHFHHPLEGKFSQLISRVAMRNPVILLTFSLLVTLLALLPLKSYLQDPFEYNFANLRNRRSLETGAAALAPRVDRIFGRTLTPAVIVADQRAHCAEIRHIILERDKALPGARLIGEVRTLDDFLPGSAEVQKQKIAVLAEIRELIDNPALHLLDDADRKKLLELRPPEELRALDAAELPETIRQPFTEIDGTLGRIILVYHDENVSVWDGRNLMRISDIIGKIELADGTMVRSSGHAVVFAAMIRSIRHDGPVATMASLFCVALLVLILARGRRGAALVIGTLCVGVVWMVGAAAWWGVRTNFLNFIALPITFGIGVDYGINIYLRYCLEGRGRVGKVVCATGGAVALCSLTTIIGYGALLVADNQALKSFGRMAILGEVACLSAAMLVMPAFLVWTERRWKEKPLAEEEGAERRP